MPLEKGCLRDTFFFRLCLKYIYSTLNIYSTVNNLAEWNSRLEIVSQ